MNVTRVCYAPSLNRRMLVVLALLVVTLSLVTVSSTTAASEPFALAFPGTGKVEILGPAGSEDFGSQVQLLPNGNIVVTDSLFDEGGTADVGAVYLYDGSTLALLSTLKGAQVGDRVGSGGISVLTTGDFVVRSPLWDNPVGAKADVGALTFCAATTGCDFVVSALNSVVGSGTNETVGNDAVAALANGNYVVVNRFWDNPAPPKSNVGAVRLCIAGPATCVGEFTSANSLTGSSDNDQIGSEVAVLTNGGFVVGSSTWANTGPIRTSAGAATLCDGSSGCAGLSVTAANSLVGTTASDFVGIRINVLPDGNYVVVSSAWDKPAPLMVGAGAVSWCSGTTGCSGAVSVSNSMIGGSAGDEVGSGYTILANGNYLITSPFWDRTGPLVSEAGAITFCSGAGGCFGVVDASNSLVGSSSGDIGFAPVTELSNGKYVVTASSWNDNATEDVGAVRLCSGTTGCVGAITSANSLVGATSDDQAGSDVVVPLPNGNYLVATAGWDRTGPVVADAGAVTFCSGVSGCTGPISLANSLVGSTASDRVGGNAVEVLANGNYVVGSEGWDDLPAVDVGAATWCSGVGGCQGAVSPANSLIGVSNEDGVGRIQVLTNGNFVVGSPSWDRTGPVVQDAGAATWCSGSAPCVGVVSVANSLIGGTADDHVGDNNYALANGNYVVVVPEWDNLSPVTVDAGAVRWCDGSTGCTGTLGSANSLIGTNGEDYVGYTRVSILPNGNYIVASEDWDRVSPAIEDAGAVTFCLGTSGCTGPITTANSLVGSSIGDSIGSDSGVLPNGNYYVDSRDFDSVTPAVVDARAITYGNAQVGVTGVITPANSAIGTVSNAFGTIAFDPFRFRLVLNEQATLRILVYTPQDGYDVNCTGGIDGTDALAALRTLAGFVDAPVTVAPCSGDVISDGDAELTLADVLAIRRRLAGFE